MAITEAKKFMHDAKVGIAGSMAERAMCALAVTDITMRLSPNHAAQSDGATQFPARQTIKLRNGEYTLTFNRPNATTETDVFTSDVDPTVVTSTAPLDRTNPQGTSILQATQLSRESGNLTVTNTKQLREPRLSFQLEANDVSTKYIISGYKLYRVMEKVQDQPNPDDNDLVVLKTPTDVTKSIMGLVLHTLNHGIEEN